MSRVQDFRAAVPSLALAALLSVPLALLTACGGGGGGGATADVTPAPTPGATVPVLAGGVAITSANSRTVAADALDTATSVDAAETGSSFVTGVQLETAQARTFTPRLWDVGRKFLSMAPAGGSLATGVAVNETLPCSGGGSVAMTGNVSGGAGMRAGDTVTLTANSCSETVDGMSLQMAGGMTITIQAGGYDPEAVVYPAHVVMTLNANNFRMVAGGETTVTSGDITIDLTQTSASAGSVIVSGTSLSNSVTRSTGTRAFTMRNYRQALTMSNGATSFAVTASVETSNSRLGASPVRYQVSTPTPIATNAAGEFTGGVLKVTGSASALQLTVTATNTFQVQVDANGDGTYEATGTATLAELQAQL